MIIHHTLKPSNDFGRKIALHRSIVSAPYWPPLTLWRTNKQSCTRFQTCRPSELKSAWHGPVAEPELSHYIFAGQPWTVRRLDVLSNVRPKNHVCSGFQVTCADIVSVNSLVRDAL